MSRSAGACELCGRDVPVRTKHHLIPKRTHRQPRVRKRFDREQRHGRTAMLCRPCHKQVHATISEPTLAAEFNTLDKLAGHPEIARFVDWVKKQPTDRRVAVRRTRERRAAKRGKG